MIDFKGRNLFSLEKDQVIYVVLLSIILGLFVYYVLQVFFQARYHSAYLESEVICSLIEKDSLLAQGRCVDIETAESDQDESEYSRSDNLDPMFTEKFDLNVIYHLLVEADLVDPDQVDSKQDIINAEISPGTAHLVSVLEEKSLGDRATTIDLVRDLVLSLSPKTDTGCPALNINQIYRAIIASSLSGTEMIGWPPHSLLDSVFKKIEDCKSKGLEDPSAVSLEPNKWGIYGLQFTQPKTVSGQEILRILLHRGCLTGGPTGVREADVQACEKDANKKWGALSGDEKKQKQISAVKEFSVFLLSRLNSADKVRSAKRNLVIVRGPEQFVIISLSIFFALTMIIRRVRRKLEEKIIIDVIDDIRENQLVKLLDVAGDDISKLFESLTSAKSDDGGAKIPVDKQLVIPFFVHLLFSIKNYSVHPQDYIRIGVSQIGDRLYNSRWMIRWSATALPAIGFVGTVRGILNSLSNSGEIVLAKSSIDKAVAIDSLGGELGLAFATTLIALLLGIVLSLFNDKQTNRENLLVSNIETAAFRFLVKIKAAN